MNAREDLPQAAHGSLNQEDTRAEAQALCPLESLQHLDEQSARRCQMILGHGETYGIWETGEAMIPHMVKSGRRIDLRRRIAAYLPEETPTSPALDALLDEGVLWLTRLALLMRTGPVGVGRTAWGKPLDATTVAGCLGQYLANLVARGMVRRLAGAETASIGFASALTAEDLREWWAEDFLRPQLMRLTQLQGLGLWSDAPAAREFKGKTTAVRGNPHPRPPERKRIPFPAIPEDYLAAMGPRVLWLIKDLGPNLLHLLETLPTVLPPGQCSGVIINKRIARYFKANIWRNRHGQVITKPPFDLKHGSSRGKHMLKYPSQHDPLEWPPRHFDSVQTLAATLQSAHLWIALLVMAARLGEVATLPRDCIEFARDGQPYANGKTYKASRALAGEEREWPMPEIMVDVFAQQVKLVEASERLARIIEDSVKMEDLLGGGDTSVGIARGKSYFRRDNKTTGV